MSKVVLSDPKLTLSELQVKLEQWIVLYGEDAVLSTDAGYNNVEIIISEGDKTHDNKC